MATTITKPLPVPPRPGWLVRLRRATWRGRRIDWSAYLFVLPFFVAFTVFLLGAIAFGVYVSFTEWGIVGNPKWVDVKNYLRALADP